MERNERIKEKKIFTILIIASFLVGSFFLIIIQYISSNYTKALIQENDYLVKENFQQFSNKKPGTTKSKITARTTDNDTTFLVTFEDRTNKQFQKGKNIDKPVSLQNLQKNKISGRTSFNAGLTGNYFNIVMIFILGIGAVLCWFIIWQFKQMNILIIKLDSAEKKALDSLIIKENFLANMSHEIRTPLNSILGFTKIIQRRNTSPDISEFAGAIGHAGENLLRIVNDVLDLSKREAGMLQITRSPFNVREFMRLIHALFNEQANEKELFLTIDIDEEVPDFLLGDATRLTQILANLIGNAIKFSSQGEITVTVTSESTALNQALLKFKVTDEGIGIDSEKLDLIFERFRQAEESISRKYGGTGLGLSIVKNLILLQNGTISVNSEPGVGTEIAFEIPYEIVTDISASLFNITTGSVINAINTTTHLLVVDDNVMNQTFMKQLLSDWNMSFTIASNGLEAIDLLQHKHFDIVLMDIQMPQMDGYTATQYIRETLGLKIPIIAMTARAMKGEKEECLKHGMDGYISKPINDTELFEIISGYMVAATTKKESVATTDESKYTYIDLTYIKEISNGSISYEKVVTRQFIDTIPNAMNDMITAFSNNDFKEINRIAHHMQTSMAIMGLAVKYTGLLEILEFAGPDKNDLSDVIEKLGIICEKAVTEARDFYTSLK